MTTRWEVECWNCSGSGEREDDCDCMEDCCCCSEQHHPKCHVCQGKGHTHAVVRNRVVLNKPTEHTIISTHRNYEEARKALWKSKKGNAIYPLAELLK